MWGQPKRSTKCLACGSKGKCSCQIRNNLDAKRRPEAQPHPCSVRLPNGKTCGRTVRNGVCPSPDH